MEVNKDEAQRCLDIAHRHLNSGNYASARKFGLKSISLFPTSDAKAFVKKVDKEEAAATDTTSSSSNSTRTGAGTAYSASTGTSSARPNTTTPLRSRSAPVDHKPVEREYTSEQAASVKAIRSSGGDFYKVLGVKKDATDSEIKKAYRKVALQMHPDKNGAPGADEAFKIVSKAFTVLSDPQKRAIFDQHGPDEGRSSRVNYDRANPTGQQFGRRGMQGDDISPEELFNMFFGGGGFGGSFHSTNARSRTQNHQQRQEHYRQQHQFQRQQRANATNNGDLGSNLGSLIQLMPLLLLILVTLTSGLFSSSGSGSGSSQINSPANDFSLRPRDQYTTARYTTTRNIPYFVNDARFMNTYFPGQKFEFRSSGSRQINVKSDHVTQQGREVGSLFKRMERNVEQEYLTMMQGRCREERRKKEVARVNAMGFWGADPKLWQEAQRMTVPSCDMIKENTHTTSSASSNPLTYRKPQHENTSSHSSSPSRAPALDEKRIYVGNLDPTLDEYAVLKLFSPYGKITKLDFMFHWHGPKKGTPRGYCFLEFEASSQAAAAVKQMNRKAVKMRPLSVSLANMAPPSTDSEKGRKRTLDPNRPTAFSLLKAGALKNASTDEKIKAMERKLAQMSEPAKPLPVPVHSSLPLKPSVTMSSSSRGDSNNINRGGGGGGRGGGTHRGAGASSSSSNRNRPY
ncbi:hypothetical protein BGX26_007409 [Mortierella sp. AD094]|nr:hypothetical protein BGX26_007409 [Mortierella sp. AD094]